MSPDTPEAVETAPAPLRFGGILSLAPGEKAHCPIDDWDFEPRFTDGRCPLCGWRPPGPPVTAPRVARIDWFWPMVALLAVVSVVMGVLVLVAYGRA